MSAATASLPAATSPAGGPSLARLTRVELRKMLDTRAGLWLTLAVVAITAVVVLVAVYIGDPDDHAFQRLLYVAVQPAGVLLPIAGILLVASEWSQRTALITFTLVPRRSRVLLAKLGASVVLSLAALVVCLVLAAFGTALDASSAPGAWAMPVGLVGQEAVFLATAMITGVGFGAALLSPAPAIVTYFALPLAFTAAGTLALLDGVAGWLDPSRTLDLMSAELMSAGDWARAGTTLALWMAVPLLVGALRVVCGEVRAG